MVRVSPPPERDNVGNNIVMRSSCLETSAVRCVWWVSRTSQLSAHLNPGLVSPSESRIVRRGTSRQNTVNITNNNMQFLILLFFPQLYSKLQLNKWISSQPILLSLTSRFKIFLSLNKFSLASCQWMIGQSLRLRECDVLGEKIRLVQVLEREERCRVYYCDESDVVRLVTVLSDNKRPHSSPCPLLRNELHMSPHVVRNAEQRNPEQYSLHNIHGSC